ncbi:MAG: cell division protein FtsZ [Candidatus Kariarchaeaceae archaeon]|jgi:cell division protein FtsZ
MSKSIRNLLDTIDDEVEVTTPVLPPQNLSSTPQSSSAAEMDKFLDALIGEQQNKIVAVGVGGGGCNAINRLSKSNFKGATTVAANTDALHLKKVQSDKKILLGLGLTRGLGAGNDPVIGQAAAEESVAQIQPLFSAADMVFVTAGMGGGTGTGAAAVIANEARKSGSLTVGVCTLPFEMEGANRAKHAMEGLNELFSACDTVIVIPNEKLMELLPNLPIGVAFKVADEILVRAVKGIVNLVITPAYVNVDFADIRQVLKRGGTSVIGMGEGEGENRIEDALRESLSNSLLDIQVMDCKAALINISGGESLSLKEVRRCVQAISQEMGDEAEIIWGTQIDPALGEKIQVTTILSGVTSPYNLKIDLEDDILEPVGNPIEVVDTPRITSIWE